MRTILFFLHAYPGRTFVVLVCMFLGALADGIGLTTLLPVLSIAAEGAAPGVESVVPAQRGELERRVGEVIDYLGITPEIRVLLALVVGAIALKGALMLLAYRQVGYTVAHVATDLRLRLLRALLTARWSFFTRQPPGAAANAIATEADRASSAYQFMAQMMRAVIEGCVYSAIALAVSWRATLAAALAAALTLTLLSGFVRISERAGRHQTHLLKSLLGQLTDVLQAFKLLKATARESLLGPLLDADTERLNTALRQRVLGKEGLRSLQEPVAVAFMALGVYFAITRWGMTLASLLVLLLVLARAVNRLAKVQRKYLQMVTEASALWSLRDLTARAESEAEHAGGRLPARLERAIELRDVRFAHADRPVLDGLSLEIPACAITLLVGVSGAGKTTIADLVAGLVRPSSGDVLVDEVPLAALDLRDWRRAIGYVPQEMLLFNDSIRRNVTLGDPGIDDARVEQALVRAGVWEMVAALPDGLDASVGERGSLFSGGQRQRIALARALVHEPRLLVLDEATAALDPTGEAALWLTLRELAQSTTILAIAHESAAIGAADRVYRIEAGRAFLQPGRPLRVRSQSAQARGLA